MERLTGEQAEVLRYRFEGYTFGDIAQMMARTEGAVKALLHRGRKTLKHLLGYG